MTLVEVTPDSIAVGGRVMRLSAGRGTTSVTLDSIQPWGALVGLYPGDEQVVNDTYADPIKAHALLRADLAELLERRHLGLTETRSYQALDYRVKLRERALLIIDMAEGRL